MIVGEKQSLTIKNGITSEYTMGLSVNSSPYDENCGITINVIAKFSALNNAKSFSGRTVKESAIVMGDDGFFWVVNLVNLNKFSATLLIRLVRINTEI